MDRRDELDIALLNVSSAEPEWPNCGLVFLGDFVDRGPDVKGTIDLVLELLTRKPSGSAVMGNHDLALVRAARLDDGPSSIYWGERYRTNYDNPETFKSYLGRPAKPSGESWIQDLNTLRNAMPATHRDFLAALPWVVEAPGHLFLHGGLTPELDSGPEEQVDALRPETLGEVALQANPRYQNGHALD